MLYFRTIALLSLASMYRQWLEHMFSIKAHRKFTFFTILNMIDFVILACLAIWYGRDYSEWRKDIPSNLKGDQWKFAFGLKSSLDKDYDFRNFTAMILIMMWFRVFLSFRTTQLLGPLIKMILAMLKDIGVFLVLYLIVLVMFASVGLLLFPDVEQFETFYNAMFYLFDSSLGNFDRDIYESSLSKEKEWGHGFHAVFLIVNLVLLLNLLIAILSNTYAVLEPKGRALYALEISK